VFEFGASHKKLDYLDHMSPMGLIASDPIADLPTLIPPWNRSTNFHYRLTHRGP
jgi:hypothetical protein